MPWCGAADEHRAPRTRGGPRRRKCNYGPAHYRGTAGSRAGERDIVIRADECDTFARCSLGRPRLVDPESDIYNSPLTWSYRDTAVEMETEPMLVQELDDETFKVLTSLISEQLSLPTSNRLTLSWCHFSPLMPGSACGCACAGPAGHPCSQNVGPRRPHRQVALRGCAPAAQCCSYQPATF